MIPRRYVVFSLRSNSYIYDIREGLLHVPRYSTRAKCWKSNRDWMQGPASRGFYEIRHVPLRKILKFEEKNNVFRRKRQKRMLRAEREMVRDIIRNERKRKWERART